MEKVILTISLLGVGLLLGCAEDFSYGNRFDDPPQNQLAMAPAPESFSTRLRPNLAVNGVRCKGTETTETFGRGDRCLAGQYLVVIDNVNTCNLGVCTTFTALPVVAELEDIRANVDNFSLFMISPRSVVDAAQNTILESVIVKSDINGNGTVFLK